jgi:hypothetical protein
MPLARHPVAAALALSLTAAGCASTRLPPPEVRTAAQAATTYRARLSVAFSGPRGRARATVLAAFARPGALRIEVPGPGGARLIVVAQAGRLTALFPAERAIFEGKTTAEHVEAVLGVALAPEEIMGLLVGAPSQRITETRIKWGTLYPRQVEGRLPDGTRLRVRMQSVETPESLPAAAFAVPPHGDYRSIDADEARDMWVRR